jgi:carboxyl-terminal processing protease
MRFVDTVNSADRMRRTRGSSTSSVSIPADVSSSSRTNNTAGRYGGIGMRIEEQPGKGVTIVAVFPNTPAEKAGIREGDIIVGIDTLTVRGWNSRRVADSLTGTPGTKVNVTFARPGVPDPIKATFTRALIRVPAVPYAIVFDGDRLCQLTGLTRHDSRAWTRRHEPRHRALGLRSLRNNPADS